MTQGEYIASLLRLKKLSINKAADQAGVSREHLSKIVNDLRGLGPEVAHKIAPVLGISAERLLALREADVETRRGFDLRLRELEARVAQLASQEDLERGLDTLRAAIDALASPGTGLADAENQ